MYVALKSKFYHTFMHTHFKVFSYKLNSEVTVFALYGWYKFYLPKAFQAFIIKCLLAGPKSQVVYPLNDQFIKALQASKLPTLQIHIFQEAYTLFNMAW